MHFTAWIQGSRDNVFRRQRTLALEMPFDKEFTISQVSSLTVPLAKQYAGSVTEKTIQRDVEKLIELELVRKSETGYIANTDILRSMIAKRRSNYNGS